jgi:hypothetical protein
MRLRILACCVSLSLTLPVCSQESKPSTARLLDGTTLDARLVRIESDQVVLAADAGERTVALDELLLWGQPAEVRKGSYLLLAGGGVILGEVSAITGEHVQFASTRRPGLWKENRLPRGQVRAIVYQASADAIERDKFEAKLLAGTAAGDVLLLTSGDSLSGSFVDATPAAVDDTALTFRFLPPGAKQPLAIAQDRVTAIVFAVRPTKTAPTARYWLGLADGSLIAATSVEQQDDTMEIGLSGGGTLIAQASDNEVEPPESFWSRVVFVQALSPRVTYLSDLKTIGFKHVPLLDWQQDFAKDSSVVQSRLRAGGGRFLKGIGMPSTSRLAYDIPAGAKHFEADIAIDQAAGRSGSVIFRVFLEGDESTWKPAFESKLVRGGDAPQSVRVPVAGSRRIALVVDMADRGDERDWADWLNARFVK